MSHPEQERASQRTRRWYEDYYSQRGKHRNDLLTNPEVLFQHLAIQAASISALRHAGVSRESARVLDVGCGMGGSLATLVQLGFPPQNLYGIDIIEERVQLASGTFPASTFVCGDAASNPFQSDSFDLTLESTMFVQLTDEVVSRRIGQEMLRVTRPGGYVLLVDWRYGKPGHKEYVGVSRDRIKVLFSCGTIADIVCERNGALIPLLGRPVSRYAPSLYFLLAALLPPLVGVRATLLRKRTPRQPGRGRTTPL